MALYGSFQKGSVIIDCFSTGTGVAVGIGTGVVGAAGLTVDAIFIVAVGVHVGTGDHVGCGVGVWVGGGVGVHVDCGVGVWVGDGVGVHVGTGVQVGSVVHVGAGVNIGAMVGTRVGVFVISTSRRSVWLTNLSAVTAGSCETSSTDEAQANRINAIGIKKIRVFILLTQKPSL